VEIVPELKAMAEDNLRKAGVTNAKVELGNGAQGWANGAPYDVIVISGALEVLPEVFLKQVKVGGRIAAIIGEAPSMSANIITRVSETAYDTVKVFETSVRNLKSAETPSHFEF
jgi:protein-L-isoaspartate(D-aspartate) O-methyltransferase